MITTINEFKKILEYKRVIPRDFFNESKLLKCMGRLQIHIHDKTLPDGINITIEESGEDFNIEHHDMFDYLYVTNYPITINGNEYICGTQYNSKDNYPFYCYDDNEGDILVFDENGKFTDEFINFFRK